MYEAFPLHRITRVSFGLVTSEHVLARSVVEVTATALYVHLENVLGMDS